MWTKNGPGAGGGDAFPAPFIYLNHHANFKHGTPITQNPIGRIVMGADGNGAARLGVACSAAGAIVVNDGSHATISDPRINNETGPAIVLLNASFLHFANTTGVSFLENVGAAAAA